MAVGDLDFNVRVLWERTKCHAALAAIELDVLELWEDTASTSDNAAHSNEAVEMRLTKLSEGVVDGEISDSNVDLVMNTFVVWVVKQGGVHRDLIEDLQHLRRCIGKEICQCRLGRGEMVKRDF